MPRMNQMFPSKWLAAADLDDQDVTLTVRDVTSEIVGQGDEAENKWVMYFAERDKGLVLNKTNAGSLCNCFGDDTDDWINKRVVLYPTQVSFSGKMVDAIRIKEKQTKNLLMKAAKPAAAQTRKAQPVTQEELDASEDIDSVPF